MNSRYLLTTLKLSLAAIAMAALGTVDAASAAQAVQQLSLTPSSAQLAQCMPDARLEVTVKPTTALRGFDVFEVQAQHLPPDRDFTVFLLEQAGAPFGAAEYLGDFST